MHVHFCNINIHINTHTWHMLKYVRVPHSLLPRFIKNHPNRIILSSIWFCRFLFISCERAALRFYVQIFPTFLQTAVICRWTAWNYFNTAVYFGTISMILIVQTVEENTPCLNVCALMWLAMQGVLPSIKRTNALIGGLQNWSWPFADCWRQNFKTEVFLRVLCSVSKIM